MHTSQPLCRVRGAGRRITPNRPRVSRMPIASSRKQMGDNRTLGGGARGDRYLRRRPHARLLPDEARHSLARAAREANLLAPPEYPETQPDDRVADPARL